jgi:hypothetical protein
MSGVIFITEVRYEIGIAHGRPLEVEVLTLDFVKALGK